MMLMVKAVIPVTRKELVQIFDLLKNKYQILSLENWYSLKTAGKTRPAESKMSHAVKR